MTPWKMKLDGPHNERALHLMGARAIAEIRDKNGELIGHHVDAELDMAKYPDAVKQAETEHAVRKPVEPPLTSDEIAGLRKLLSTLPKS
jgi:hypothetical protein